MSAAFLNWQSLSWRGTFPNYDKRKLFMTSLLRPIYLVLLTFLPLPSLAEATAETQSAEQFEAGLHYQTGPITLPGGIAALKLTERFRYLPPEDAERLLTQGWGNPPSGNTLGMIIPAELSPLAQGGWGVVITYDKDGHVKDDDAQDINYADLLSEMQADIRQSNDERKAQGFGELNLLGWAEQPSYDKASHKLFWAKELQFDQAAEHTLNYNVRVLGREGVLVLNAVSSMGQIGQVKADMQQVIAATDFTPCHCYEDFDEKTDKIAEYGLAALVAGGVASKLGLFRKLLALAVAFKKLIILGLAAAGAFIVKLFSRRKS